MGRGNKVIESKRVDHMTHWVKERSMSSSSQEMQLTCQLISNNMRDCTLTPPPNTVCSICSIQEVSNHFLRSIIDSNRDTTGAGILFPTVDPIGVYSPILSCKIRDVALILQFYLNLAIASIQAIRFWESNCKREGSPLNRSVIIVVSSGNDSSLFKKRQVKDSVTE